jgi:hypothetical protein
LDLLKILRSFEEFLFEAVTWLFFYPRTMLRIVSRPLTTMAYSDAEEGEPEERRYDDALSPPVLLLITLVLANAIAWAAHVPQPANASPIAKAVYSSPQNLLFFRCLLFSLAPLVSALTLLRKQRQAISRHTLRRPFYAQCYLAAPCAFVVSMAGIALQRPEPPYVVMGAGVIVAATGWLIWIEARWFARALGVGMLSALATALGAIARAFVYLLAVVVIVALL